MVQLFRQRSFEDVSFLDIGPEVFQVLALVAGMAEGVPGVCLVDGKNFIALVARQAINFYIGGLADKVWVFILVEVLEAASPLGIVAIDNGVLVGKVGLVPVVHEDGSKGVGFFFIAVVEVVVVVLSLDHRIVDLGLVQEDPGLNFRIGLFQGLDFFYGFLIRRLVGSLTFFFLVLDLGLDFLNSPVIGSTGQVVGPDLVEVKEQNQK